MVTFPPRSPIAHPIIDPSFEQDDSILISKIEELEERIKRLEQGLEENTKLLQEIRELIEDLKCISEEAYKIHLHKYDKIKLFSNRWFKKEKTSPPI